MFVHKLYHHNYALLVETFRSKRIHDYKINIFYEVFNLFNNGISRLIGKNQVSESWLNIIENINTK